MSNVPLFVWPVGPIINTEPIRYVVNKTDHDLVVEALREQNRVLRLALEPFAKVAEAIGGQVWVQYLWVQSRQNPKDNVYISAEHVRAAKAALTATSQPGGTHEL